ncbi:heme ABC exporter ATP-binding protein CcmA [Oceanicaulis sp.]|uniref:heme ABC exporter ATP-binding protein CcmA n=1 Tax=Oceanicaulis sp. TaxID=1924941 RepID=UPI003F70163C
MSSTAAAPARITVSDLRLERGGKTVLTGFSLTVEPGEALVLLGPNGSGKTTLLRALGGLVRPVSGEIGLDPQSVAFLGHADALKPSETVEQALAFWAGLYGGDASQLDAVMVQMALAHLARRTCGTLSAGQKRRTALARIALSNRPVWLLDEPAAPLDARSRERLAALVKTHCQAGGVVIAATHVDLGWAGARVQDLRTAPTQTGAGVG